MKVEIDFYTDFENKEDLKQYNEFLEKYKENVEKIVKLAVKKRDINEGCFYVGLGIVSKENIQATNKETRNIDKVTDVLSFPMQSIDELEEIKISNKDGYQQIPLGDIVICLDKVKEQAIEYGTGLERELLYMITHGMCHLMGYDHEDKKDKVIMRKIEEDILKEIEGEN